MRPSECSSIELHQRKIAAIARLRKTDDLSIDVSGGAIYFSREEELREGRDRNVRMISSAQNTLAHQVPTINHRTMDNSAVDRCGRCLCAALGAANLTTGRRVVKSARV